MKDKIRFILFLFIHSSKTEACLLSVSNILLSPTESVPWVWGGTLLVYLDLLLCVLFVFTERNNNCTHSSVNHVKPEQNTPGKREELYRDLVRHDRQTDTQDGGLHLPDGGRGGLCRQRDHLPGLGVSEEAAESSDDYHHSLHHGGEYHLQRCGPSATRYSLHELQVNTRNICSHNQHLPTGWRFILI